MIPKQSILSQFAHDHPRIVIILAMLFWGASFPAMKFTISAFNPYFVVWARMCIGMCCLLPFIRRNSLKNYQRGDAWWLCLMVLFEPALYFVFELEALQLTTASQAGFISSTLPLMVIVSGALILKERIFPQSIVGISVAFAGAVLLTLSSGITEAAPNPLLGNTFEVFAMLAATAFTLILKKFGNRYSPLFLAFIQTLGGTVFFTPIILFQKPDFSILVTNPIALAMLLFLGIVVTVLAYLCYISGIQKIPANEAIIFVNLIPVFGLFLSMIFLAERLNITQWIACLLLLSGVLIGQFRSKVLQNPAAESA